MSTNNSSSSNFNTSSIDLELTSIFELIDKDKTLKHEAKSRYFSKLLKVGAFIICGGFFINFFIEYNIVRILVNILCIGSYLMFISYNPFEYNTTLRDIIRARVSKIVDEVKNSNISLPKEFFDIDSEYISNFNYKGRVC